MRRALETGPAGLSPFPLENQPTLAPTRKALIDAICDMGTCLGVLSDLG
jgi:hypothetical protein